MAWFRDPERLMLTLMLDLCVLAASHLDEELTLLLPLEQVWRPGFAIAEKRSNAPSGNSLARSGCVFRAKPATDSVNLLSDRKSDGCTRYRA